MKNKFYAFLFQNKKYSNIEMMLVYECLDDEVMKLMRKKLLKSFKKYNLIKVIELDNNLYKNDFCNFTSMYVASKRVEEEQIKQFLNKLKNLFKTKRKECA